MRNLRYLRYLRYLKKIKMLMTGGRPMIQLGYAYTELLSGKRLYDYIDNYGRLWIAPSKWSWWRLKNSKKTDWERREELILLSYGK